MQKIIIISMILGIIFTGCDSNSSSTGSNENPENQNSNNQTIITSSIYEGNYYFDLINGVETDSASIWQISFQNKTINWQSLTNPIPPWD